MGNHTVHTVNVFETYSEAVRNFIPATHNDFSKIVGDNEVTGNVVIRKRPQPNGSEVRFEIECEFWGRWNGERCILSDYNMKSLYRPYASYHFPDFQKPLFDVDIHDELLKSKAKSFLTSETVYFADVNGRSGSFEGFRTSEYFNAISEATKYIEEVIRDFKTRTILPEFNKEDGSTTIQVHDYTTQSSVLIATIVVPNADFQRKQIYKDKSITTYAYDLMLNGECIYRFNFYISKNGDLFRVEQPIFGWVPFEPKKQTEPVAVIAEEETDTQIDTDNPPPALVHVIEDHVPPSPPPTPPSPEDWSGMMLPLMQRVLHNNRLPWWKKLTNWLKGY